MPIQDSSTIAVTKLWVYGLDNQNSVYGKDREFGLHNKIFLLKLFNKGAQEGDVKTHYIISIQEKEEQNDPPKYTGACIMEVAEKDLKE